MSKKSILLRWLLCLVFLVSQLLTPISMFPQYSSSVYAESTNSLKVEFFNNNKAYSTMQVYPQFKITNTGTNSINFSDVKIRYYYTIDTDAPQKFGCDWSTLSINNITGSLVKMPNPQGDADYYLEIGFNPSSGIFNAGESIVIQTRFGRTDNINYNQTNDYSFNSSSSNYVEWYKVSAHIGNTLVWGQIPGGPSNIVYSSPSYGSSPSYTPTPRPTVAAYQRSAFDKIEAESYNVMNSQQMQQINSSGQTVMSSMYGGDYLIFRNLDFGNGAISFKALTSSTNSFNIWIRTNGPDGFLLATLTVNSTGNWNIYQEQFCNINQIAGVNDICLVFSGSVNIDWFRFYSGSAPSPTSTKINTPTPVPTATQVPTATRIPTSTPTLTPTPTILKSPTPAVTYPQRSAFTRFEGENYNSSNVTNIKNVTAPNGGSAIGYIEKDNYVVFNNVNFGSGALSFRTCFATTSSTSFQIRLNSASGTLLGTCYVNSTGAWETFLEQTCSISKVGGIYDVYLVFSNSINIDWFMFYENSSAYTPTPTSTLTPTQTKAPTNIPTSTSKNTPTSTATSTPTSTSIPTPTPFVENIALNKTTTSDSQLFNYDSPANNSFKPGYIFNPYQGFNTYNYPATENFFSSYAVDGNMSSRWCAANDKVGHYLQVDLGGFYNISSTEVNWYKPTGSVNKYRIDVSSNSIHWAMKVDRGNNKDSTNVQTDNFLANGVRYVRITVTGLAKGVSASISEFKININRNSIPPTPQPIQSTSTPVNTPITVASVTPSASNSTQTPTPTSTIIKATVTPTSIAIYDTLPSPDLPDSVVANLAPEVPDSVKLLSISRVIPSVRPTIKPYSAQNLSYSLTSDVTIQAQKKNKEIILALDTSASMRLPTKSEALNEDIFNYTLFSGETDSSKSGYILTFESTGVSVKGTIHSNGNVSLNTASNEGRFEGNIEAVGDFFATWGTNLVGGTITSKTSFTGGCNFLDGATIKVPTDVPVIKGMAPASLDLLRERAKQRGVYYLTSQTSPPMGQSLRYDCPVYADGDLTIQPNSYIGNGLVAASGDVTINGTSVSQDAGSSMCIYSNKDIYINCNNGTINGTIFAPNGKVNLSGTNLTINGKIIAKSIRSASSGIKIIDKGYPSLVDDLLKYYDNKLFEEKEAAKAFIDKFAGTDTRIGIVSYAKTAVVAMDSYKNALFSLSRPANVAFLKAYIDRLEPQREFLEGTKTPVRNIGDGLRRAYYVLDNSPDINSSKFVVVFADGAANVRTIDDPSTSNPMIVDGDAQFVSVDVPPPAPMLGTAEGYASYLGGMMRSNYQKIYYVSMSGEVSQLENIAVESGSSITSAPNHYYINALPQTILSVTNLAATSVDADVQYLEYAEDLHFTSTSFNEIFPLGVTVLSVAAPYNYFKVTKLDSGPYKGRYQVSAKISGLVLHKISQSSDGISEYKLMTQKINIDEYGNTSFSLEPVQKIVIKIKYTAKAQNPVKASSRLFYWDLDFNSSEIEYVDYFGNKGLSDAPDYKQRIYYSPDLV